MNKSNTMKKIGDYHYKNGKQSEVYITYGTIRAITAIPGDVNPNIRVYKYKIESVSGEMIEARTMKKKSYRADGQPELIALDTHPVYGFMMCEPWQAISRQAS